MIVAGIDVAARTLAVVMHTGEKSSPVEEFPNTTSGHQAVLVRLRKAGVQRVCLEATGAYHLDLRAESVDADRDPCLLRRQRARAGAQSPC